MASSECVAKTFAHCVHTNWSTLGGDVVAADGVDPPGGELERMVFIGGGEAGF